MTCDRSADKRTENDKSFHEFFQNLKNYTTKVVQKCRCKWRTLLCGGNEGWVTDKAVRGDGWLVQWG